MENNKIGHHISEQFNHELEDIRNKVLTMGGLVERQLKLAMQAFSKGDMALAEEVIRQDSQINTMESEIDHECIQIIALRQPTAFDLRLLIAIIRTITELERIGDQAKRIANMSIHLANDDGHDGYYELEHIAEMAIKMLHQSLDDFARMDLNGMVAISAQDAKVSLEYKSIVRQLITKMMEDPRNISRTLDVMSSARALERIAAHASNVSEYLFYIVRGEDVRHLSTEELNQKLKKSKASPNII